MIHFNPIKRTARIHFGEIKSSLKARIITKVKSQFERITRKGYQLKDKEPNTFARNSKLKNLIIQLENREVLQGTPQDRVKTIINYFK